MFVLRRETRCHSNEARELEKAMLDMQLLLRGVWRFHSDEGREFMCAVELAEKNVLSFTPQPTPTIETRKFRRRKCYSMFSASCKRTCVSVA